MADTTGADPLCSKTCETGVACRECQNTLLKAPRPPDNHTQCNTCRRGSPCYRRRCGSCGAHAIHEIHEVDCPRRVVAPSLPPSKYRPETFAALANRLRRTTDAEDMKRSARATTYVVRGGHSESETKVLEKAIALARETRGAVYHVVWWDDVKAVAESIHWCDAPKALMVEDWAVSDGRVYARRQGVLYDDEHPDLRYPASAKSIAAEWCGREHATETLIFKSEN